MVNASVAVRGNQVARGRIQQWVFRCLVSIALHLSHFLPQSSSQALVCFSFCSSTSTRLLDPLIYNLLVFPVQPCMRGAGQLICTLREAISSLRSLADSLGSAVDHFQEEVDRAQPVGGGESLASRPWDLLSGEAAPSEVPSFACTESFAS